MALNTMIYALTIPIQVEVEVWEELYLDPWIEYQIAKLWNFFGWSDGSAGFWAMFACSFREVLFGAASAFVKGSKGSGGGFGLDIDIDITSQNVGEQFSLDYALDSLGRVTNEIDQISSHIDAVSQESKRKFKAMSVAKRIANLAILIPSFTVGAGGLAATTYFLDQTTDFLFQEELGRAIGNYRINRRLEALEERRHDLEIKNTALQALLAEEMSVTPVPRTNDPLTGPYSALISSAQVQGQIESQNFISETRAYNEHLRQELESTKALLQELEEIEDSTPTFLSGEGIDSRVTVQLVDPRFVAIAEKVDSIRVPDKATFINPKENIHRNKLWIKTLMGIRGNILIIYRGLVIEVGQEISGFGQWLNDKYSDTKYSDEITPDTILFDALVYLGYDFDSRPAIEPVYIIPTSQRYNPSLKIDTTSAGTITSSILPLIYNELFKSQKVADFVSEYKLLFDQHPQLLENILISSSKRDIEKFIDNFNTEVDKLLWELFHITDFNMVRGEFLSQVTLNIMKNRFMDKWVIKNPTTSKEVAWNIEVKNYWGDRYEKVLRSTDSEVKYKIFKKCFGLSVLHVLFVAAETNKIKDFNNILTKLVDTLDKGSLNNIMARIFLIDTYIRSSFGVFQIVSNEYDVLRRSYSTFSEWKGYLAEADEIIKYLPIVLKEKFLSGEVLSLSKVISKFYYGRGRDIISPPPHILLSTNFRFPDLGIWKFELTDVEDFDIEYILQASKYSSNKDRVAESLKDILSSLYTAIRENIQSKDPKLKLKAEASLLNLLSLDRNYNTFNSYFRFFLDELSELNFYNLKVKNQWKVDRLLVAEEEFIIKELNDYIWKKYDYSLSTTQYINELNSLSNDASFILKLYNNIRNKDFGTVTIDKITDFLRNLVKVSSSIVSTITALSYDDHVVVIPAIIRTSSIKYYHITNKFAIGQYSILKKVFNLEDSGTSYQKGIDITSSTEFNRAYKVIHTFDSKGNPRHGLVEVSQNKLVPLPDGWFDGLIILDSSGQEQLIDNLLFTDHFGHLLSSSYFNPDTGEFTMRDISLINDEILNNPLGTYGINILIDFSKMDPKGQMNSLITIDLTNNEFNTNVDYYLPSDIGNYFENLDTTSLIKVKSKSLTPTGSLNFHPIAPLTTEFITTQEFYELYYNIIDFHTQGAAGYSYPNTYILDLLEEINAVFDPYSGYIDSSSKRSIEDNEGVLNRLFRNKAEIRDFLLINKFGDPLHESEMSIKDWISFIFDKVTDPDLELGNDRISLLLIEALKGLERYKTEGGSYANPFNIGENWFSEVGVTSELEHGRCVFEVINRLFGHVSLMYLFLHRIGFYEGISGFKLDFYTITPTSREIEALVNQYNIRASSQESRWDALLHQSISEHIFSLLFSNSFMYLPTKTGALNEDNKVYFGYSPMPFLSAHLSGSSTQELNRIVLDYFKVGYNHYSSRKDIGSVYTESCESILDAFSSRLWETISARRLGIAETNALYEQASLQAKYDIFKLTTVSSGKFSIRYQVENLLIGYQYSHSRFIDSENYYQRGIVFHNLKVQKVDRFGNVIRDGDGNPIMEPLVVFLDKDDLKGRNIQIFREASEQYPELYNTLEQKFLGSSLDRLSTIVNMILKNSGKVRFYITINRGPQYGYQYINIVPGKTFRHLRSYYDINLDLDENGRIKPTKANQKELEKIEFLVALSGTYIEYFNKVKSSVMLIMKEEGTGMGDNSICGINHNSIFRIKTIHSQYGAPDGDGYILQQIYGSLSMVGNYFIGPDSSIDPNYIWIRFSNFQPVSQTVFLKYYDSSIWD